MNDWSVLTVKSTYIKELFHMKSSLHVIVWTQRKTKKQAIVAMYLESKPRENKVKSNASLVGQV